MTEELTSSLSRRPLEDALQCGPWKKVAVPDPLVRHGRHFGRVCYAFCSIKVLLTNGLLRLGSEDPVPLETVTERHEDQVFQDLLKMCPGFKDRLCDATEEEIGAIADLVQKGVNGARSDDTKTMKSAIIDWITPQGQTLTPPLSRKIKSTHGFHHEQTGALLCPAGLDWTIPQVREKLQSGETLVRGDQWPLFLYADLAYDPNDHWNGLLRSQLLVAGFKHVFTSPSSVDNDEPKATRSGNARIHGMTAVTKASLAYIATQVHFALCSSSTFSRMDVVTDSETFYKSLLCLLEDLEEKEEVNALLSWWDRKNFPHAFIEAAIPIKGSALSRIKEKRRERIAARSGQAT